MEIIEQEQSRLKEVLAAVQEFGADRKKELARHDALTDDMERERFNSVDWKEKNEIAERLVTHGHHNPRKYLIEFKQEESPYFGIVGIHDENPKIGKREYLIGLQSLILGTKAMITDWRKAEISRFFYDYEVGEDYEETIAGQERLGIITRRDKVDIARKALRRIQTATDTYDLVNGEWCRNGEATAVTAEIKCETENHQMVENIAALISAEQFRAITEQKTGIVIIEGGAGCGKTTVMMHRASFLIFNSPDQFRAEDCLVLMFNRSLRDYVKRSSDNLLEKVPVSTFSAWALGALNILGVSGFKTAMDDPYTPQKKDSDICDLLELYVKGTNKIEPIADLWRFYAQKNVVEKLIPEGQREAFLADITEKTANKSRMLSFADISVLLRLTQLRQPADKVIRGALNFYPHICVDEAQDLSFIDLEIILAAASPEKSMSIAADEKQQILNFVDNNAFPRFRAKLQTLGLSKVNLSVSYRCPKEIIDLANKVIGRSVDTTKAHKGTLEYHEGTTQDEAVGKLRKLVVDLQQADSKALIAIICKKKAEVKTVHKALEGTIGLHPVGDLCYDPGILVVNAHQVKGLEFSSVVLWNPSTMDYRQGPSDRNLLYVGITRASRRLDIVHWQKLAKGLEPT